MTWTRPADAYDLSATSPESGKFLAGEAVSESSRGEESKVERLRRELTSLRKGAGLREPGRIGKCRTLTQLAASIRRRTVEDDADPLVDARDVLMEAAKELTAESRRIFAMTFALGEGGQLRRLEDRRATLARQLGIGVRTMQEREDRILSTVAYSIVELEQTTRLRQAHGHLERRQPVEGPLAVDWLGRFRHYYRMWTDLSGLRNDLGAFLVRHQGFPDDDAVEVYGPSSLHYFTRFLAHLDQFVSQEGGLWLLSSPDTEVAVSDAVYQIAWHPPADDLEQSWLRTQLHAVAEEEKYPFAERLRAQPKGRAFLARWNEWLRSCAADPACVPNDPAKRCDMHKVIMLCDFYLEVVEREWNVICDWYHLPPEKQAGGSPSAESLFQRHDYRLPGLEKYGHGETEA